MLHGPGVQLPQQRHHLQPHQVPGGRLRVGVGLILHVRNVVGGGVLRQLRPGDLQKGPQDILPLGRDARKAL